MATGVHMASPPPITMHHRHTDHGKPTYSYGLVSSRMYAHAFVNLTPLTFSSSFPASKSTNEKQQHEHGLVMVPVRRGGRVQ